MFFVAGPAYLMQMSAADPFLVTHGLWADTSQIPRTEHPRLEGEVVADVAVVGGGYTGLSTALHLAEAGASVCVLEAITVGHGASGRNGGQINPGLRASLSDLERKHGAAGADLYRMAQEAPDFLCNLVARHNMSASYERNGAIKLAHSRMAAVGLEAAAHEMQREGIAAELLDQEAVRARVGTGRYLGGLIDPRGGAVHPLDLAREYARVAASFGARIFERSRARSLQRSSGGWRVATDEGVIVARDVVLATNAYSDEVLEGLSRTVLPVNSFQIATEPVDPGLAASILPERQTAHDTRRLILYFRRLDDGRVILGGRASFDSSTATGERKGDYDVLQRVLEDIFPALRGVPITHRWTGLVGITLDGIPHYGQPAPGLHSIVGFNGRGVALTSRAGAWIANRLLGHEDGHTIPILPLSPIPLHSFRRPILDAAMRWHRLLDAVGR